jgi:hypothetical protein
MKFERDTVRNKEEIVNIIQDIIAWSQTLGEYSSSQITMNSRAQNDMHNLHTDIYPYFKFYKFYNSFSTF